MGQLKKGNKTTFTVVNNEILHNKKLDTKLRGLLITMLSLPDDWNFSVSGLQKILPDGRDSISKGLQKLEELGYLKRERVRNDKGQLKDTNYYIYDTSQNAAFEDNNESETESKDELKYKPNGKIHNTVKNQSSERKSHINKGIQPITENQTLDTHSQELPITDFPTLAKPTLEKPILENPTQLNNIYNNINNNKKNKELNMGVNKSIYQSICNDGYNNDGLMEDENTVKNYSDLISKIKSNIKYDDLLISEPIDKYIIDEIVEVIAETVAFNKTPIQISGNIIPTEIINNRLLSLNSQDISTVLMIMSKNKTKIHNVKKYLLSVLVNLKTTANIYMQQTVNYDTYHS